ncbi:hypothetical protein [uncultured Caulobacter sp.]|uniref:hypothetical protein n=1 Tax=uncultured Caulobacter sp. TaxID=158749 RepID=UPI00261C0896|nr:hypothetical protein [uncultured Caulobacter sp.]
MIGTLLAISLQAATTAAPPQQRLPEPKSFNEYYRQPMYFGGAAITRQAEQMARAKRAATLINAGRCDDALQAMKTDGDRYLAARVAEVCELSPPEAGMDTRPL